VFERTHRGKTVWVAQVDHGIEHGRRERKTFYGKTKTEVLDKKRDYERKRRPGRAGEGHEHTVKTWLEEYMREVVPQRNLAPNTLASYRSKIDQYIVPLIGQHRLDQLEARHVARMYARLRQECPEPNDKGQCRHSPSHGLSEGTLRQTHAILSRALKIAVRYKLIAEAETANVDPPTTEQEQRPHLLTPEADLLLASVTDEPDAARWHAALILGMRQGECLALPWGAVNFADESITLARSLTRLEDGTLGFKKPKSKAGVRTVPIPKRMLTLLQIEHARYVAEHGHEPEALDLVWCQATGKPRDPSKDHGRWKALLKAAGLPAVTLHSARQSAARRMEESGVPERLAAEILGHSNVSMTYRYQRGAGLENQRAAMAALDG
jgi:integrase